MHLSPAKAAKIYGIETKLVESWIWSGHVPVSRTATRRRLVGLRGQLAIAVIETLRRSGASMSTTKGLLGHLFGVTDAELESQLREGKCVLWWQPGRVSQLATPQVAADKLNAEHRWVVMANLLAYKECLSDRIAIVDSISAGGAQHGQ